MKIIHIIGTRPQFIKIYAIRSAIEHYRQLNIFTDLQEVILNTGQHYNANLCGYFESEFELIVDYNLDIREKYHGKMTARMIAAIEEILITEKPDRVLVYGDTNSTLSGALAAAKLHIPIAHIESGLRSFNMNMPEEINRIITDRLSTWLFCPNEGAVLNLTREGIGVQNDLGFNGFNQRVFNVGDVMFDVFYHFFQTNIFRMKPTISLEGMDNGFYLATVHRSENTDNAERLHNIMEGLDEISGRTPIVMPIHPRTKNAIHEMDIKTEHIRMIDPVGYLDMMHLLKNCDGVFTDSGGLQKEAYFMRKFCVILRDETEWIELVENGYSILAGASRKKIIDSEVLYQSEKIKWTNGLFGNGDTGRKIVQVIFAE